MAKKKTVKKSTARGVKRASKTAASKAKKKAPAKKVAAKAKKKPLPRPTITGEEKLFLLVLATANMCRWDMLVATARHKTDGSPTFGPLARSKFRWTDEISDDALATSPPSPTGVAGTEPHRNDRKPSSNREFDAVPWRP